MGARKKERRVRKRLGRPPLPESDVRSNRIVTFLTANEMEAVVALSQAEGTSISSICHRLIRCSLVEHKSAAKSASADPVSTTLESVAET